MYDNKIKYTTDSLRDKFIGFRFIIYRTSIMRRRVRQFCRSVYKLYFLQQLSYREHTLLKNYTQIFFVRKKNVLQYINRKHVFLRSKINSLVRMRGPNSPVCFGCCTRPRSTRLATESAEMSMVETGSFIFRLLI